MTVLKDHSGKVSMMRVALATSLVAGCTLIVAGIFAVLTTIPEGSVLVNAGAGLMSVGSISKAFQSRQEQVL